MQQHSSKYFAPPPPDPGGLKVKIQLLQNMVMLHIKLKEITQWVCNNMVPNILPTASPPPPPFDLTHPTSIWVRLKSDIEIIQKKIKLTTKTEVDRLLTF